MGCLAMFFVAQSVVRSITQLYFSQRIVATGTTTLHSVSPLQQLFSQFYGSFNKCACAHFSLFVPRSSGYENNAKIFKLLRSRCSETHNLQCYIFKHFETQHKMCRRKKKRCVVLSVCSYVTLHCNIVS